ncbi:MAG: hypothetical protein AAFX03_09035 [Pseudomonadota bacterium]
MTRFAISAISMLAALAAPAAAEGMTAKQTVARLVVVETDDGRKTSTLAPADKVAPGEEVVYAIDYRNTGSDAADNVSLVMPIPDEVVYVEDSATSGAGRVEFSADNGGTFAPRDELIIGAGSRRHTALAEDITHVRWTFADAVAPGASGQVLFHAIVR